MSTVMDGLNCHPKRLDYVVSWWKQSTWLYTQKMHTEKDTERLWFAKISEICKHQRVLRSISNCSYTAHIYWKKRGEIHGEPSLLRSLIAYINTRDSYCLLSEALCSRELRRRCNDRLIPAFVECDEGGGEGGAELSRAACQLSPRTPAASGCQGDGPLCRTASAVALHCEMWRLSVTVTRG